MMELNKRLAELLGWTSIIDVGGALLGRPPGGAENSRDQAAVPDWCGDWRAAGPLLRRFGMTLGSTELDAIATCSGPGLYGPGIESFSDHDCVDDAMRSAIVSAVANKLEAGR
jgi:hypothetical protein